MKTAPNHKLGFTLLELLVSIAVISILFAILLPAVGATRNTSRDIQCRAGLRNACQRFLLFADTSGAGTRGNSDTLGDDMFLLEDFQESVYGIDEFWQGPPDTALPRDASSMMCPSATGALQRRPHTPCSAGGISPQKNVSIGFNRRLHVRSRMVDDTPVPATAHLTSQILHFSEVPLVFDVAGDTAVANHTQPYYMAPPILTDGRIDIYEQGEFWFPSYRHRSHVNVGFIGGHVQSTTHPTEEPWWRWDYQPNM